MKFSWRAVLCAVVMVGATGAFKACKDDGPSSGGEDPPKTVDDSFPQITATAAMSLNVIGNDTNLTNEPLTYTIEDSPTVGSASFNADHTVALSVPSGFKGVTKFRYKITNSLGGFSISNVVAFVDVPGYRALYAAKSSSSVSNSYEIYVSDFLSAKKISSAVTGNVRLKNMWLSKSGQLVAYERGDPAQATSTELFFVKPTANPASPTKFPLATGRKFVSGGLVTISDDSRWIAYLTDPTSGSGGTSLYVLDSTNAGSSTAVASSAGLAPSFTQWKGTGPTLYFMAPIGASSHAVVRAGVGAFDSPQRVSPLYTSSDQESTVLVSPDESRILIVGTHNGQNGAFFIDPANPGSERRLTTDMPAGASIESFRTDENVSRLVYLWRATTASTVARVSVIDINADDAPQTVYQGDVVGLSDLRSDNATALITRGPNVGSDGRLFEVTLDGAANPTEIASNVTGGVYADTDRIYLYSRTLTPSVIQRSDFERTPSALVRSTTPSNALFVAPIFEPSAAILQDTTSGLVIVNAAAPGKTLKLTDADSQLPSTLYPTIIGPAQ